MAAHRPREAQQAARTCSTVIAGPPDEIEDSRLNKCIFPALGVDLEQGDVSRVDARDARSLAESAGLDLLQLHARLGFQARHSIEIHPLGDGTIFIGAVALDVGLFALEVALVLDLGLELGGRPLHRPQ